MSLLAAAIVPEPVNIATFAIFIGAGLNGQALEIGTVVLVVSRLELLKIVILGSI